MKIFVTGGTGYIGSHTVVELQQNGYDVVIVDNLCNSNIGVLDGIEKITGIRPEFEQIDLTEGEQATALAQQSASRPHTADTRTYIPSISTTRRRTPSSSPYRPSRGDTTPSGPTYRSRSCSTAATTYAISWRRHRGAIRTALLPTPDACI